MLRDFNDLQFFAAVVQQRGFSAGARALGLPKSRVSRRVAVLEERLGVRLLDRTTRGVNLTEVGQQVFEHARAAVLEAEAAEEAALRMQSQLKAAVSSAHLLSAMASDRRISSAVRTKAARRLPPRLTAECGVPAAPAGASAAGVPAVASPSGDALALINRFRAARYRA